VTLARAVMGGVGEAPALAYLMFGAGLFLSGFAGVFLINRDKADQLRIDGASLVVVCLDGSEVAVPLASLLRASARLGNNRSFVVVLQKRDGGVIELCATPDESGAQEITKAIQRHIDGLAPTEDLGGEPQDDPIARLAGLTHVTASRRDDALEVSFSAGGSPALWLVLFGPLAGMGCIVLGFHKHQPSVGTLIATAFIGLLVALTLWSIVRQIGVTMRLRIDGRDLVVERLRGGKVIRSRVAPIFSVVAIDYTHQLEVVGGQLLIRLRAAQDALEEMQPAREDDGKSAEGESEDEVESILAIAGGVVHLVKNTEYVPTGALTLSERVAVDLALSEELARRSGRVGARL
jgi:hypothetical protein